MTDLKGFLAWLLSAALLYSPIATPAFAQPNTPIQHIIVIVQENRTADNLFYVDHPTLGSKNVRPPNNAGFCTKAGYTNVSVPLTAFSLDNNCFDPSHLHNDWLNMYHGGAMDGACKIGLKYYGTCLSDGPPPSLKCPSPLDAYYCPQYTYADDTNHILDPYLQIADTYGFANYMFQTNQGPSFPSHQFLFSGTSAPVAYPLDTWNWFAADNAIRPGPDPVVKNGCIATADTKVALISDTGQTARCKSDPNSPYCKYPCYDHKTLADVLNDAGIKWRYYARTAGDLFTAPNAISHICGESNGKCQSDEWLAHVKPYIPGPDPLNDDQAPIITDIKNCQLAPPGVKSVTWVIPDGHWSDHPGHDPATGPHDGGPDWVRAIVNAVGQSYTNSGGACDYWGGTPNAEPTAIFVVWDDWGGFYDHVPPMAIGYDPSDPSRWYVYAFRVPLLVVSAYAKRHYVSGPASEADADCPGSSYCHDFGSILNFTRWALGEGEAFLPEVADDPDNYHFADYWAPDARPVCLTCDFSLSDFFDFGSLQSFTAIATAKYDDTCFQHPASNGCFGSSFQPEVADNDATDNAD